MKALKEVYPFLKVQRCIVHSLRNVAIKLKRVHLKPCMAEAKDIFNAPSRREAIRRFKEWKEKWQVEEDTAVRCMEKGLHHCLHRYSFPKELWKKVRTTNVLEQGFRQVRRRTRPMAFFPTGRAPIGSFVELPMAFTRTGITLYLQSQQRSGHDHL